MDTKITPKFSYLNLISKAYEGLDDTNIISLYQRIKELQPEQGCLSIKRNGRKVLLKQYVSLHSFVEGER
jgi:hypothetical protein